MDRRTLSHRYWIMWLLDYVTMIPLDWLIDGWIDGWIDWLIDWGEEAEKRKRKKGTKTLERQRDRQADKDKKDIGRQTHEQDRQIIQRDRTERKKLNEYKTTDRQTDWLTDRQTGQTGRQTDSKETPARKEEKYTWIDTEKYTVDRHKLSHYAWMMMTMIDAD